MLIKKHIPLEDASNHFRCMRKASLSIKPTSKRREQITGQKLCIQTDTPALPLD